MRTLCSGVISTMVLYCTQRIMYEQKCMVVVMVLSRWCGIRSCTAESTGMALPLAAKAVYKETEFSGNNVKQNLILDYRACGFLPRYRNLHRRFPAGAANIRRSILLALI
jgi:hypothetical protein